MVMQWVEFLDTAGRLSAGSTEGDWRSAISRSYYAVFHYFREFLLAHGLDIGRGGQSHFNLYAGLNNCGIASVIPFALRINNLRSNRVEADYNLRGRVLQPLAGSCVREAHAVVAGFQALLTILAPAQIVGGVRNHLQAIGHLPRLPRTP
jgi:uncharacterized protein (UPF0332 family)